MITWENYEEYMIMHADGELQPHEMHELEAFVNSHPQLKKELEAFMHTRMQPDPSIVFTEKRTLIKEQPAKQKITIPVWRYSIAAGIAAILLMVWYTLYNDRTQNTSVARISALQHEIKAPVTPAHAADCIVQSIKPALIQEHAATTTPAHKPTHSIHTRRQTSILKIAAVQSLVHKTNPEVIPPLAATVKTLPAAPEHTAAQPAKLPADAANSAVAKRSFWDKLPIDDIKKKELDDIARSIKQATDGEKFSLRIEKRKLVLSF